MPGKVRVKILAGRNLPVMDRSSDTTDAYVEIKFGTITCKTDVYRKSLHPQWNSDWFRFEVDDADLQDEPLQIRIMDHDTYSANDAIGKVNISLNPLLLPSLDASVKPIQSGKGSVMSGWIPVFDTMHGIRGEINLIVKVDLFSDVNKFRQSSCGVQFFHSPIIPYGYHAQVIHGFVEELVVNDDPEYQWIDKIRTPRASNEARQVVFLKLSAQVQRKIGLKAIDLGANAVIGYNQCFDLEGDVGVVARGIGTAVTLIKIQEQIQQPPPEKTAFIEEQRLKYIEFLTLSDATNQSDSKFDFDAFNTGHTGGDIVYKILGIDPDEMMTRVPSIIINKKMRKDDPNYEAIEEEKTSDYENLKHMLQQEELHGEKSVKRLRHKIKKIKTSSTNLLNKKLTSTLKSIRSLSQDSGGVAAADECSLAKSHSYSDFSLYSPSSSVRNSEADIGAIVASRGKQSKSKDQQRISSDGVGMTTLLVRSLMAAPSLDSIAENHDPPRRSPTRTMTHLHGKSNLFGLPPKKRHTENKLNLCVGDSIIDLKASDGNLSSNQSISSGTLTSSSEEEDDFSEINENDVVMIDADTISMVVKSVLAKEEGQLDESQWIQPLNDERHDSDSDDTKNTENIRHLTRQSSFDMSIKTGATRIMNPKDKKHKMETCLVETEHPEGLEFSILATGAGDTDEQNWIQPGSTREDAEDTEAQPTSMLHDFKESISEKLHNFHLPHHHHHPKSEIKDKHGLLETAMETMLMEQANFMGAQRGTPIQDKEPTKLGEKRNSSIESFKKMIVAPFRRQSVESIGGHHAKNSQPKQKFGLFDSAMKTMLIETANIIEGVGVHPKNENEEHTVVAANQKFTSPTIAISPNETDSGSGKAHSADNDEFKTYDSHLATEECLGDHNSESSKSYHVFFDNLSASSNILTEGEPHNAALCNKHKMPLAVLIKDSSSINAHSASDTSCLELANLSPENCGDRVFVANRHEQNLTNNLEANPNNKLIESKSVDSINKTNKTKLLAPNPCPKHRSNNESIGNPANVITTTTNANISAASVINDANGHIRAESIGSKMHSIPTKVSTSTSYGNTAASSIPTTSNTASALCSKDKDGKQTKETICRRSSDSDLSVTPKALGRKRSSLNTEQRTTAGIFRLADTPNLKTPLNLENLDMLEYPFLTLSKYPAGFILQLGSTVSARSVKLLERVPNPDEPETRDFWWTELRMEIRSHARALGCNVILGYTENTSISDDVCVLSVIGTAAIINHQFTTCEMSKNPAVALVTVTPKDGEKDMVKDLKNIHIAQKSFEPDKNENETAINSHSVSGSAHLPMGCLLCHIPSSKLALPVNGKMKKCAVCKKSKVPEVLLATIEIPESLQIIGRGCLIHSQACRYKKDLKSESNAKEISDALPFLEYDLQRLLVNKLKAKGMNAIFGLKISISIGEKMMALIGTGTGVYLPALPSPNIPKIVQGNSWTNVEKINELNRSLEEAVNRNREIYQLKVYGDVDSVGNPMKSDVSDDSDDDTKDADVPARNKDICILEIDDVEDLEIISLILEPGAPEGFHVVNTQSLPGLTDLEVSRNLQMFTQVWRAKFPTNQKVGTFPKHFLRLLQTIYFKLRSMIPCAICDLKFRLDLPDGDEFQILVNGIALGLSEPNKFKFKRKLPPIHSTSKIMTDDELIFNLEDEQIIDLAHGQAFPVQPAPLRERYGVDITPLTYIPGGRIDKYLGNLNFFFIRESTSIRENGGISGFVHSFITELLAVVRAHTTALGGNAMVSFYMSELILVDNPHKNQGQTLISVGGDVVFVSYFSAEQQQQT